MIVRDSLDSRGKKTSLIAISYKLFEPLYSTIRIKANMEAFSMCNF